MNLSGLQLIARWLNRGKPPAVDARVDLGHCDVSEGARGLPGFTTAVYKGSSPPTS
ncbi:MAG: hypothetical protein GY696_40395 [Gammaproteobacteria bacterium]|nr:hypothetical protein [Gammaproteobacteria bacterium]